MKTKKYLLDTNICISMLKNKYGVRETILKVKPENCYVSEITLGELYFGASFSNNKEERLKDVAFIINHFKVNAARKSKVDDNTARMQSIKQLGV